MICIDFDKVDCDCHDYPAEFLMYLQSRAIRFQRRLSKLAAKENLVQAPAGKENSVSVELHHHLTSSGLQLKEPMLSIIIVRSKFYFECT